MTNQSIPCVVMASINIAVGIYYLYFHLKRPQIEENFPFGLLCISIGLYDVSSAGLYNSTSLQQGVFWQRLQLDFAAVISIFIIWFSTLFTKQPRNKISWFLIGCFLLFLLASFFISPQFTVSTANPAIKHIFIDHFPEITYYEGSIGLLYQIEILFAIGGYIYLMFLFFRYYRKTRDKALLLILSSLFVYFFTVLNDALVVTQVYSFIYINEYSFTFIIATMAYILLNKFVDLHLAYEELNINLEQRVKERTSEIELLNKDLKRLADYDGLTGVYNRRFFDEYFGIEVKRANNWLEYKARLEPPIKNDMNFGIAMIDIDHFKKINDQFGHAVGDNALIQVVEIMKNNIFTRDVLCRYGGDEFVLLLTKTSNQGILQAVEKIRKEIDEHTFILDDEGLICLHLTVSIGLVKLDEVVEAGSDVTLKLADNRLLQAKSQGRNRIVDGG